MAVLVFLLLYLPFVNKAVHIDDISFIFVSQLIGWNPLVSAPTDYPVDGVLLKNALPPYEMTHPLLLPYLIKIVSALFGQNEVALHVSFLLFPMVAAVSLFMLYRTLFPGVQENGPLVPLFLCSMPAFLVNSHNLMTDVPTLSFLLLAMACYCLAIEREFRGLVYLAGLALCVAAFISYQALFFTPVILLYAVLRRRLVVHVILSMAIPAAAMLVWFLLLYETHGLMPFFKGRSAAESPNIIANLIKAGQGYQVLARKGISIFAFIGSSMLFLVPAYLLLNRQGRRLLLAVPVLLVPSYVVVAKVSGYSLPENVFLSVLVAFGLLALLIAVRESLFCEEGRRNRARGMFLLSWVLLVVAYTMLIFPWCSARYVLPALPPLAVVLVAGMGWDRSARRRMVVVSALCLSLVFGLASAYSDYRFANTYREFAEEVKSLPGGSKVWYIGAWGMQYYMDRAGARYLLQESDEPRAGDFVIFPEMPRLWMPSPLLQKRMRLVASRTDTSPVPLRLFNGRSQSGFYSNAWGLLPFAVSGEPDEVFLIYKVMSDAS